MPERSKNITPAIISIVIVLLVGIILIRFMGDKRKNEEVVSCSSALRFLYVLACNYKEKTGKDVYDESKDIHELLDTLIEHEGESGSLTSLKYKLKNKKIILYLVKNKDTESIETPLIVCQLYSGRCLVLTRGKQTLYQWDHKEPKFIPDSLWYENIGKPN
jgi:hypothetical protein